MESVLVTRCARLASLLLLTLAGSLPAGAATLRQESFEQPSDGTNYVAFFEHGYDLVSRQHYFKRGTNSMFRFDLIYPTPGLGNVNGAYYFGGEDTDWQSSADTGPTNEACWVQLKSVDIRGFQNLKIIWAAAAGRDTAPEQRYLPEDYMEMQVSLDAGSWTNIGAFRGTTTGVQSHLKRDTNLDGFGDGTTLTRTFADFTNNVSGLGTGLQVRAAMYMTLASAEAAFDNIRVTGDAITPTIAITNPPAAMAVMAAVTNYNVAGIANLGVVGDISWTNSGTGARGTIAAATNWTVFGMVLGDGVNGIMVWGSNTVGGVASNSVTITRVLPPLLTITNPATDIMVSDLVELQSLQGTASESVMGPLLWENQLTGATGTAAAGSNWTIAGIDLLPGTNTITVTATNIVQQSTNDTRRIYQVPLPVVTITNPTNGLMIAHDVAGIALGGTASGEVFGMLRWTNALNGAAGAFPRTATWATNLVMGLGTNTITVTASNIVGRTASASISVYKVAAPVIGITNPTNGLMIAHDVASVAVGGTASGEVYGMLRWTNALNGAAGAFPRTATWSTNLVMGLGTNAITVSASNIVGRTTSASVSIYKVAAPVIGITNPTNGLMIAHDVTSVAVGGTASGEVFGMLRWTNALNGAAGAFPRTATWTTNLVMGLGTNAITVTASNIVGRTTSASVSIYKVAAPVIGITNPTNGLMIAHDVASVAVGGTASGEVFGMLRWTNALNGAAGAFPRTATWSTNLVMGLGTNAITVSASNIVGRTTSASVSIYKVAAPVVTVTNPTNGLAVAHLVAAIAVGGTASGEVMGLLRWTNALNGAMGAFPRTATWNTNIVLALGTNTITVTGSNVLGRLSSASVSVYKIAAPTLDITDPAGAIVVTNGTVNRALAGTANGVVGGILTWSNALNGVTGTAAAGLAWNVASVPLALGINTVTIRGTNHVGVVASDSVAIAREGAILLNELLANPVGDETLNGLEFVEALRVSGTAPATNLDVLVVNGNDASAGLIDARWEWTGAAFGANGLLLTGDKFNLLPHGAGWSNDVSPHTGFADPAGMGGNGIRNQSVTILLVRDALPAAVAGYDLDTNNDGVMDSTPWAELLDSVGWLDGGVGDRVYSPAALAQSSGTPDAATRLQTNRVPGDASAWYCGDLSTNATDGLGRTYVTTPASANLPAGAVLTPGRYNFPYPYDQDADALPDWWEQLHFGGATNAAPGADNDHDDYSNLDEFWAGSDPMDDGSVFGIDALTTTGLVSQIVITNDLGGIVGTQQLLNVRGVLLEWESVTGRVYTVHGATNLAQSFTVLSNGIAATPPSNIFTNPVNGVPLQFFRLDVGEPIWPW
jgi:hypothetical protein